MDKNLFPGTCYQCGVDVPTNAGQRIRNDGDRNGTLVATSARWLVRCRGCAKTPATTKPAMPQTIRATQSTATTSQPDPLASTTKAVGREMYPTTGPEAIGQELALMTPAARAMKRYLASVDEADRFNAAMDILDADLPDEARGYQMDDDANNGHAYYQNH